jgi:hypothetical protein
MSDNVCPKDKPFEALQKIVVFAFNVAEENILNLPENLEKTLNSEQVRQAMSTTLTMLALTGKSNTGKPDENKKLAEALLTKAGQAAGKEFLEQLKKTPEVQELQQCVKDFESALKSTPAGVWVDKHQKVVYVVGAILLVGGAAALFVSKVDNPLLNFGLDQLKGTSVDVYKVGKLTLSGQVIEFNPAAQNLGLGLIATEKWEKVTAKLQIGVVASAADKPKTNGQLVIQSEPFKLLQEGALKPQETRINFGLGLSYNNGALPGPVNISFGAIISNQTGLGAQFGADMNTKAGKFTLKGMADTNQYGAFVLWDVPLKL